MDTLFTFGGSTNVEKGVYVTKVSRTLKPVKRHIETVIPGRSGTYDYTDGSFENGAIELDCMYTGSTPASAARDIAGWLDGTKNLIFADEPDKHYVATAWTDIENSYVYNLRKFKIVFSCEPFARSTAKTITQIVRESSNKITIPISGTAPTPCRIEIYAVSVPGSTGFEIQHTVN